jgi:hypothetical protein
VRIRYTNNAPHSLEFVWLQLDQNLFRPGSQGGTMLNGWNSQDADTTGGIDISNVMVDGQPVTPDVHGTVARLDLPRTIAANGGKAIIAMHFRFRVPQNGVRMGRDGSLYLIGQWYPRMAVYDDVRGWNTNQYLGHGEFYLEYGDFDYAVTLPAGYTVAGSGTITNPTDVLSAVQRSRLARARRDSAVVPVITRSEASANRTRQVPGTRTWRFSAKNVRDVAWAAAPDFRWDATSWNGILCQSFYSSQAGKDWEHAAEETRWSIQYYSKMVAPYPYPQVSAVASGYGMEYPMLTFDLYGKDTDDAAFGVITHEVGHQWFPMVVGSNERRYPWMDEGLNTYMNILAELSRAEARGRPTHLAGMMTAIDIVMRPRIMPPIMTAPDHGGSGAPKPSVLLMALRDQVVGRATFDRAFRLYFQRWAYRHPTPADFFRTIDNVSGQDLSWFWRGFFYSNDVLDIGIDSVYEVTASTGAPARNAITTAIRVRRMTAIPFPLSLRIKFADGTTRDIHAPVDALAGEAYVIRVTANQRAVGVRLWPRQGVSITRTAPPGAISPSLPLGSVPDMNPANDVWGDAPDPTPISHGTSHV